MLINEKLGRVVTFVSGGVAYSLIDKAVNYHSAKSEAIEQSKRGVQMDNIDSSIQSIDSNIQNVNNNVQNIKNIVSEHFKLFEDCRRAFASRENTVYMDKELAYTQLNTIKDKGNSLLTKLNALKDKVDWGVEKPHDDLSEIVNGADNLLKMIGSNDITNNLVTGLSDFYQYVENLTILEHSILLDILLFLLLILTVINILSALFGNEIIRYFNLETRFPRLSIFFRVRSSLQRYYLMWNVFVLMFVCLFGICINIVVFVLSQT